MVACMRSISKHLSTLRPNHKKMIEVKTFTFNAFQENTYLLIDTSTKACIIIDPGNSNPSEDNTLLSYITDEGLTPIRLINTHCHIDHVLGNHLIADRYGLPLEAHEGEIPVLEANIKVAQMYGVPYTQSPQIASFLKEDTSFIFGEQEVHILFTPGHSPASICLSIPAQKILIGGDVLFNGSIGRTDLPGGNFDTLLESIRTQLYVLDDETIVYSGHGRSTMIGHEKRTNPFVQG